METKTLPTLEAGEYAGGLWYYEPHVYMPYRYVLGRPGARPLVCIGINPSTAQPGALAPPSRAWSGWRRPSTAGSCSTSTPSGPQRYGRRPGPRPVQRWLAAVLDQTDPNVGGLGHPDRKAALPDGMREMVALTREKGTPWVTFGKRSKAGHPHHPLYLRKDAVPEPFDVEHYLDTAFERKGGGPCAQTGML